jgi:hypothetical protein
MVMLQSKVFGAKKTPSEKLHINELDGEMLPVNA